jgi:hypothetical protein
MQKTLCAGNMYGAVVRLFGDHKMRGFFEVANSENGNAQGHFVICLLMCRQHPSRSTQHDSGGLRRCRVEPLLGSARAREALQSTSIAMSFFPGTQIYLERSRKSLTYSDDEAGTLSLRGGVRCDIH